MKTNLPAAPAQNPLRRALGLPFSRPDVFVGSIASVGENTLRCDPPVWSAGEFSSQPHFVKIRSGQGAGRMFLVKSNTADTLTLENPGQSLNLELGSGNVFGIFPAHTLLSVFGGGGSTAKLQSGSTEQNADLVRLNSGSSWVSYYHDGNNWRTPGSAVSQDETIIRPDQGVFLICKSSRNSKVIFGGAVSVQRQLTAVPRSGEALLPIRFPLASTLNALQLHTQTGWKTASAASQADNVMLWNGTSWNIFYHTGSNWEQSGSFANQNNATIPAGGAFLVRRFGSADAGVLEAAAPFLYP
jgi:uncharacterized protein (TIGR02597 family)